MPSGIERFSSDRKDAIQSFLVPAILFPLSLIIIAHIQTGISVPTMLTLHTFFFIAVNALFMTTVYVMSKSFDRREHFWKFISALNWMNLASFLLMVPYMIAISALDMPINAFEHYAVFLTLVNIAYAGFITTYALKLPWEMGGFITIIGLLISRTGWDLITFFQDTLV